MPAKRTADKLPIEIRTVATMGARDHQLLIEKLKSRSDCGYLSVCGS